MHWADKNLLLISLNPSFFRREVSYSAYFRKTLALFSILFIWSSSIAQTWNDLQTFGNQGSDGIDLITPLSNGDFIAAGTFTESIKLDNQTFIAQGKQDLWLAKFDEQGKIDWAIQGSSPQEDVNKDLKIGADGSIFWVGTFWQTAQFGNLTLEPFVQEKSIFILKISNEGEVENGEVLFGSGAKDIGEIEMDAAQNIFLTGNFSNTISFQDTSFLANEADVFVTKLDANFDLVWWTQIAGKQTTSGKGLGLLSTGEVVVAGDFQGEMILENDTIATRTPDEDLFYAKFSSTGNPLFMKRAGGVFPAFCKKIEVDNFDNFYLLGNHRGLILVDTNLQIQTSGVNDNFYLIALDENGKSRWGKSLGSRENDGMEDAFLFENEIFLAGNYAGSMTIDQRQIDFPQQLFNNGFFASFSTDNGDLNWIHTTQGSEFILGKTISKTENTIWAGGDFSQEISANNQAFETSGFFDFFLGEINSQGIVAVEEIAQTDHSVFPNPTSSIFQSSIENAQISLYSFDGKLMKIFENGATMDISDLSSGLYFLQIRTDKFLFFEKLIKN